MAERVIKDIKSLKDLPDDEEIKEIIVERGDVAYRLHIRRLTNAEWSQIENDEPPPNIEPDHNITGQVSYNYDSPSSRAKVAKRSDQVRLKRIVAGICEDVPGGNKTKLATNEQVEYINQKFGDYGIYKIEQEMLRMKNREANSIMLAERFHARPDTRTVGDGEVVEDA